VSRMRGDKRSIQAVDGNGGPVAACKAYNSVRSIDYSLAGLLHFVERM
jgi:hypothetical protein